MDINILIHRSLTRLYDELEVLKELAHKKDLKNEKLDTYARLTIDGIINQLEGLKQ